MKNRSFYLLGLTLLFFLSVNAEARDLVSASQTYTNTLKNVAQIISVAGILCGSIIMQIPGASFFGRNVLTSGIVGSICAFGAPAIISLLKSIFGSI